MVMFTFFNFRLVVPFLAILCPKNGNCLFRLKFGTYSNSNMQNLMTVIIFSGLDWKHPILGTFGSTNQNCLFKVKFGTYDHVHNILRLFDG